MDAEPTYMEIDYAALPKEAQFATWAAGMPAYRAQTRNGAAGFEAKVRVWFVPPVVITESRLGPVRFARPAELIASDGLDSLTLQLILSGRVLGSAAGVAFRAERGDVAVQDAARPLEAVASRSHTVTATMPRSFLDASLPNAEVHGLVLRGGVAAVLAAALRTLPDAFDTEEKQNWPAFPRLLRDLLAAAMRALPERPDGHDTAGRPVRERVRRFVARHVAEELTADSIAAAVGASRASLYRAFSDQGGVMAFVLEHRLTRLHRALREPAERCSLGILAARHGFRDGSEMGRAFRKRFGITPGEARAMADPVRGSAGPAQRRFRRWVEEEGDTAGEA